MAEGDGRAGSRALSLVAAVAVALAAGLIAGWRAVDRLELQAQDAFLRIRGRRASQARIVLAEIDNRTLAAWSDPMIVWGAHHARALTEARRLGVGWVGLDFIHAVDTDNWLEREFRIPVERRPDRQFAIALLKGNVVLSSVGATRPIPALLALPSSVGNLGSADAVYAADGSVREAILFAADGERKRPAFAPLIAARILGKPVDRVLGGSAGKSGRFLVNYLGPPGSFPRVSYQALADGRLTPQQREMLRGSTLLVGATYDGNNDIHLGPAGRRYAGVEVQANALATILDGAPIRRADPVAEGVLTAVIALLGSFLFIRLSPQLGSLSGVALAVLWAFIGFQSYRRGWWLPVAGPYLGIALAWAGEAACRAADERRRRAHVESVFGRHVSKTVVDQLLSDPKLGALGGQRRVMSILFADIREFTPLSDRLDPEEVVEALNEFFGCVSDCVLHTGGTLNKYLGDGLMAFWNSPTGQDDHADRAVGAAQEMLRTVTAMNQRRLAAGRPELRIGIGVNSGEVVVGCIGSQSLRDYTVIGSAVNLAARLETANRELGTNLLLGEETYRHLSRRPAARLHEILVKGFSAEVKAYELLEEGQPIGKESPCAPQRSC